MEEEIGEGYLQLCEEDNFFVPDFQSKRVGLQSLSICDEFPLPSSSPTIPDDGNLGMIFFQDGAILLNDAKQEIRTGGRWSAPEQALYLHMHDQ